MRPLRGVVCLQLDAPLFALDRERSLLSTARSRGAGVTRPIETTTNQKGPWNIIGRSFRDRTEDASPSIFDRFIDARISLAIFSLSKNQVHTGKEQRTDQGRIFDTEKRYAIGRTEGSRQMTLQKTASEYLLDGAGKNPYDQNDLRKRQLPRDWITLGARQQCRQRCAQSRHDPRYAAR